MSSVTPVSPSDAFPYLHPGTDIAVGNVIGAAKVAEKTVELTTCAQFGRLFGTR